MASLSPLGHGDVPAELLLELTLKTLYQTGRQGLHELARRLCLPLAGVEPLLAFLRQERLCESGPPRNDHPLANLTWQLSESGRQRAATVMEKCRYVGPAPVPLENYVASVEAQHAQLPRLTRELLKAAFHGIVCLPDCSTISAPPCMRNVQCCSTARAAAARPFSPNNWPPRSTA
ncbi:hypothetical protein MASR1M60_19070 [Rhodocyclaceae bacterium]